MKKEMYSSEVTLLRDTFRRLLRRHAKTNIVKLIDKTHPSDLALIFRYFNETEQDSIFSSMLASEDTVKFLYELDESIATRLIENEAPERLADIMEQASSNEQAFLMGLVSDQFATSVIDLLQADEQEELEEMRVRMKKAGVASPQYNSITRESMRNSISLSEDEVQKRIQENQKYVIRLKIPRNEEVKINDLVRTRRDWEDMEGRAIITTKETVNGETK